MEGKVEGISTMYELFQKFGAATLQQGMAHQADALNRAVEAAGSIANLETQLNRNLSALAGAKNFEQTVMSLAAAIHLLNARLSETPAQVPGIQLDERNRKSPAA